MSHLQGKIAIVTGGARGIGAAISRDLAKHGATVVLTYSKSADAAEKLAKEIGGTAIKADASEAASMSAFVETVVKQHGRIDILVNNAGVLDSDIIGESSLDALRKTFAVNVDAVYSLTNAAVPHIPEGGRIINISSVLGERAIMAGLAIYNSSKFAVTGLTRSWAKDLGPKNITVNAVQPGPINTDMNPADGPGAEGQRSQIALGRYGKPEEIAAAVTFFASPQASFITGATLNVDGGMNA
jgi:3-oxoacyl-[acyl-carrier protein] reductase